MSGFFQLQQIVANKLQNYNFEIPVIFLVIYKKLSENHQKLGKTLNLPDFWIVSNRFAKFRANFCRGWGNPLICV